jgi:hypothetical protein
VPRLEQHRHHHCADVPPMTGYQNFHPWRSFAGEK